MKPQQWQVAITDDIQTYPEIVRNLKERLGDDIEIVPAVTQTPQEFMATTRRSHALVGGDYRINRETIEQLERCMIIAQNGVGFDNIDLEAARQRGIRVTNVPDYGSGEVAAHALTLILALARRLPIYDKMIRSGQWDKLGAGKILRLSEATLGILGLRELAGLAKQASALGCRIIASDPYVPAQVFAEYNAESVDLPTLVTESDYLSLNANYTPETHHLIGANEFAQMKPTTVLVNTARGKLMDEQALIEALKSGQIAAAGLDVFTQEPLPLDSPLRTLDNVILTPHAAWYSVSSLRTQAARTANEVILALTGQPTNYALVELPLYRLTDRDCMTSTIPPNSPIRLALIGAGIFAKEAHLPPLQALIGTYKVVAVCSRTEKSASTLAGLLPNQPDIYTDVSSLLARDDIDALDILVPIDVMAPILEMALASGKHIISEKPLAPDLTTGGRLLELHQKNSNQVWMVAENWRHEPVFLEAARVLKSGTIGKPLLCHWADHYYATPATKYYQTAWRQEAAFPGGYLLDGGIHRVAALRMILGEITGISAVVTQLRPDLPPADTLHTALCFENGVTGSYSFTAAVKGPWSTSLYIVGENGSIEVNRFMLKVTQNGQIQGVPVTRPSAWHSVYTELENFAAAIYQQQPIRNTPQQGLQDVAVIEAMLQAARTGQHTVPKLLVK